MEQPLIYGAISNVMSEIGAVGKNQKNQQQNFTFRGIDAVMNAINPALIKNKVFMVPEVLEQKREERQTKNGGNLIYSICKMKYTFFAEDGSNIQSIVIGEGMDSGDKATNKAMSIAFKYACFQVFCIPTEEMKDPDADSNEVKGKDNIKNDNPKSGANKKENQQEIVNTDDIRSITDLVEEYSQVSRVETSKIFNILYEKYSFSEVSNLHKEVGKTVIKQLETWIEKQKKINEGSDS